MKRQRTVLVDTNVVVAGLLTANPASPTARVLDGMLQPQFVSLLSEARLAEYRTVLLRPAIRARHDLSENEIDDLLAEIVRNGIVREPVHTATKAPDRHDQHLWDLIAAEPGAVLITGDVELLENLPPGVRVLDPRQFVDAFGS